MSLKTPLTFSHGLTSDARKRLKEHFSGDGPSVNDRWAALWDEGSFLPWDRGTPSPALQDSLEQHHELFGSSASSSIFIKDATTGETRRKRALVPGCGRGYDVLLLASFGYDAYGLEVSEKAVELCREFAQDYAEQYPVKDVSVGAGKATFLIGDFFKDDWLRCVADNNATFELFYDYTFLCALQPSMRPQWALRYAQLLSPQADAQLICLEFPTYKEPSTGGPPFGVASPVYVAHLGNPGIEQPYDAEGNLVVKAAEMGGGDHDNADHVAKGASPAPVGFQRVAHWKAERTHEVGKGTDWVSVWRKTAA